MNATSAISAHPTWTGEMASTTGHSPPPKPFIAAVNESPQPVFFFIFFILPPSHFANFASLDRAAVEPIRGGFVCWTPGMSFSTLAPFISPNNPPKNLTGGQTRSTWVMTGAPWLSVWIFTLSSKEGHAYKSTPALPSSGSGSRSAGGEERKTAGE